MREPIDWRTTSEEETIRAGREIAALIGPNAVALLIGDLGAGKTTLAKGIVGGLNGIEPSEISSPTFTLIHEYGRAPKVYHIDLYRLEEEREVESLGLDELFDRPGTVLIEWGERFPRLMPEDRWEIRLSLDESDPAVEGRFIRAEWCGAPE